MGTFNLGTTGLVAQSVRLNVIASNVANAETAVGPDGSPYKARHVVFKAQPSAGVALGVVTGGTGASTSFALARELLDLAMGA